MAKMAEQMELFEPVERGFNEGGDMSSAKDAAMQDLQSSAADKKAARKDQFDKLTDMLMSGEIKDMPEEKQQKFIKLYKMMKSQGFNEGGLMEEGGMVDEESGNEVPPGSLREEVRDDIPAQLSEGEFVFPADVVRYIGLENLMRMRQEAKQGLAEMEAMGQMGNSEEATMPDNLPFDLYDLEVEDDGQDQLNFQVGGYVPPTVATNPYNQQGQVNPQTGVYQLPGTGIAGYQVPSGGQTGYTPYGGAAPYFQPVQFTGPQFQTATQTTNLPTFAETVGTKAGQYDELKTYQNDAGQTLQIPFKDGKPIYPIPEGYRPIGDQPAPEEDTPTTVTPTLGQAQVRDEGDERDKEGGSPTGASISLGGNVDESTRMGGGIPGTRYAGSSALVTGATSYNVSFEGIPGGMFNRQFMVDLVTKDAAMPPGSYANVSSKTNPKAKVTLPGVVYNEVRTNPRGSKAAAVQEAIAARDAMTSKSTEFSYDGNTLSYTDPNGNTVDVSKDAIDVLGESFYKEINDKQEGGFFSSGKSLVEQGLDLKSTEEGRNIQSALSAFNDQQFADFFGDDDKGDIAPSGPSPETVAAADAGTPPEAAFGAGRDTGRDDSGPDRSEGPSGQGCFAAGTKFFMYDGSLKPVENIKVGDVMMDGGKVRLSIIGDGSNSDWYMYGATKVTGSHAVKEQGVWKFTRDTENAVPAETEDLLYTIVNTHHRMIAEDKVVYADYDMVDEDGIEEELLEMMNLQEVVKKAA